MSRAMITLCLLISLNACQTISSFGLPTLPPTVAIPSPISFTRTPLPSQTPVTLPADETPQPTMTSSAVPLDLPEPITPTPTRARMNTPSATPRFPPAFINILRPGSLSKVVSPIRLVAQAHTGAGGKISIELTGEDGSILYRRIMVEADDEGVPVNLDEEIEFEIPVMSEAARLSISIDDRYQRPLAANSVDLILLSLGDNDRNITGDGYEPIIIRLPYPHQPFSGRSLTIEGLARLVSSKPVWAQLITTEGAVVGIDQFYVIPDQSGSHVAFKFELAYSVTQQRSARLILYQESERIPGVAVLTSVEVVLKP